MTSPVTSEATAIAAQRPTKPRLQLRTLVIAAATIAFTVYAAKQSDWEWGSFISVWSNPLWERFWPIDWEWVFDRSNVLDPLIETFQIAVVATVIGCALALPISFMMSKLTTPNRPTFIIARSLMNVLRAIPDLLLAVVLVAAVSIGAFGGAIALTLFSLAVLVKLFSESIDGADPRALEAALAAGGRHTAAVRAGVFPEVFPAYVAYSAYVFELNVRASVVIGLVGGGGIGRVIEAQRQFFRYDRILGILIVIFVIVAIIEQISDYIRRRVL
ncbi:MAG: phosphonate ABC transporter, permease protein PhnE [Ilumatobacteraceae bacterium]